MNLLRTLLLLTMLVSMLAATVADENSRSSNVPAPADSPAEAAKSQKKTKNAARPKQVTDSQQAITAKKVAAKQDQQPDPALLTLDRIYSSSEFSATSFSAKWQASGATYETLEKSARDPSGQDLVQYDAATGARSVVVPSSMLIPDGESKPLTVDSYAWSHDRSLLLIYTNSKRVWRRNTRGDYWLLDRGSHELRQVGGDAAPSSLMFATLSPSSDRVA